jgi:hypothetical protein
MDYSILAPPKQGPIDVVERWSLTKDGKTVSEMPAQTVRREPGGWRSKASTSSPPTSCRRREEPRRTRTRPAT